MPSNEYWEGRNLEKSQVLKDLAAEIFKLDKVESDGSTGTKGDLVGFLAEKKINISVKYASGGNTQVHLPTLKSLASQLDMPKNVYDKLDRFFGTNDRAQWKSWCQGLTLDLEENKYQRIKSKNIENWIEVETWFNNNKRKIAVLLLQSLNNESPAPWLIWANKKKGGCQAIDVNKFIDWMVDNCQWITMPKGTVLRFARPDGKPIFFVQMKNSGGPPDGYNHCPQFHLHNNWPKEFIIYENTKIQFQ